MAKGRIMFDRRAKQVVAFVAIFYTVLLLHYSNSKYGKFFSHGSKALLPTTSHLKGINLKKFSPDNGPLLNLRDQLSYAFPYDPKSPIPRRVWQTWKVGPDSKDFPSSFRSYQRDWSEKAESDSFEYALVPDDQIMPLLENLYGEVPLVIKAFKEMPATILRADFLRYLLLYARGGIYSDMDTIPLKSFKEWPSLDREKFDELKQENSPIPYKNYNPKQAQLHASGGDSSYNEPGFVIGIEADPDRSDWNDWYARRIQFCQWTIQSKPGHPVLRELILNITATTLNSVSTTKSQTQSLIDQKFFKDYNVNYRDRRGQNESYPHEVAKKNSNVDGTDIMNWTGPGLFSDITLEYMNNLVKENSDLLLLNGNLEAPTHEPVDSKSTRKFYKTISTSLQSSNIVPWEFFSLMTKPVVVDDILVLPITSFSPDVEQMEAKSSKDEMAFVKHMFKGSWKTEADNNAGH